MAKRVKESEPEAEIINVADPLVDAPVVMETEPELPPEVPAAHSRPSLRLRVRSFLVSVIRVVIWIIIFGVFGAGLYFGLPLLYQKFVAPVEQNTAQMTELQSRQEQTEQGLADLQNRLPTLESGQSQNVKWLTELDRRVGDIETDIAAHTRSLAALEQVQSEIQAQNESASVELERQINRMKAMELLSRARLFMYQSNFGLAEQDVQIARDLLAVAHPDVTESAAAELDAVILRLDLTLSNLPDFPVAASDDLDIAWQILLSGMPQAQTPAAEAAAPTGTALSTPEATVTPTPPVTVMPSATP